MEGFGSSLLDTPRSFIIEDVLWPAVVGDVICLGVSRGVILGIDIMDNVIEFGW
jgi:hypothetical protein